MTLRKELETYKKIILDLIESVKKDGELPDSLLEKKNAILQEIKEAGYNKEDIERNLRELDISCLENELELAIKKEMVGIKKKIENIKKSRIARDNYINSQRQKIILFRGKA